MEFLEQKNESPMRGKYMIDPITYYLLEGYLFSNKDISVDLDKFESGSKNKLLIVGTTGSGKTTLAEKLSKKYKSKWISIDSMWWRLRQKYFKNAPETDETERKLIEKIVKFTIDSIKGKDRLIIEGVDLLNIYSEYPKYRSIILDQTMIILGLSSLKGGIRAGRRNASRGDEDISSFKASYLMTKFNIKHIEPILNKLRKDVSKKSDSKIEEYKIKI